MMLTATLGHEWLNSFSDKLQGISLPHDVRDFIIQPSLDHVVRIHFGLLLSLGYLYFFFLTMCIVVQDDIHEGINKALDASISTGQINRKSCMEDWPQGCSFLQQQQEVGDLSTEVSTPSSLTWHVHWNLADQSLHQTSNDRCLVVRDIWSREYISSWCYASCCNCFLIANLILDGCIGLLILIVKSVQDLGQSSELDDNGINQFGMLLLDSHIMSAIHILMFLWTNQWEVNVFQDLSQS